MNSQALRVPGSTAQSKAAIASAVLLLLSFAFLYQGVIAGLVSDWVKDDNYSHGFFILPLALYFAWKKRSQLREASARPSNFGLLLVMLSLATLLTGMLGSELFLTRASMIGTIAGLILFVLGWQYLRLLLLPLLFLLLMIPIPAILLNQIAFPLQLIASRFGETALEVFGIPVLREGNVIHLANISLEVVEACSGIRSLISLLTLSIVYGYFTDNRIWIRTVLALATMPIAILANGMRVAFTGVASYYYGPKAAEGFFHSFSGWMLFVLAFVMLFIAHRAITWLASFRNPKKA
jgi:exosortase